MSKTQSNMIRKLVPHVHLLWQLAFYVAPLFFLVSISFWALKNYQLAPTFTVENYRTIFSGGVYLQAFRTSLWLAGTTALLAVALALPVSQAITFHLSSGLRLIVIFAMFLPFFSSYTIRTFSWQLWLSDSGILASGLRKLGLLAGPLGLLYTEWATRIGLLSVLIPIGSVIVYLSMSRLDRTIVLAAQNLGASRPQVFRRIILPFAAPGIVVAFLFCFIISFGDFISPSILGGNQIYTLAVLVQDRVRINDWPTASAVGVLMLALSAVIVALMFGALRVLPTARRSQ